MIMFILRMTRDVSGGSGPERQSKKKLYGLASMDATCYLRNIKVA